MFQAGAVGVHSPHRIAGEVGPVQLKDYLAIQIWVYVNVFHGPSVHARDDPPFLLLVAHPARGVDEKPNGNRCHHEQKNSPANQQRAKPVRHQQATNLFRNRHETTFARHRQTTEPVRDQPHARPGCDQQGTKLVRNQLNMKPVRFVGFLRLSGIEVRHLASLLFLRYRVYLAPTRLLLAPILEQGLMNW